MLSGTRCYSQTLFSVCDIMCNLLINWRHLGPISLTIFHSHSDLIEIWLNSVLDKLQILHMPQLCCRFMCKILMWFYFITNQIGTEYLFLFPSNLNFCMINHEWDGLLLFDAVGVEAASDCRGRHRPATSGHVLYTCILFLISSRLAIAMYMSSVLIFHEMYHFFVMCCRYWSENIPFADRFHTHSIWLLFTDNTVFINPFPDEFLNSLWLSFVSIGSGNGLVPYWHQAITWTNADVSSVTCTIILKI